MTKIPFGKFKDCNIEILYYSENEKYSRWLIENCKETLNKFPDFRDELLEAFGLTPEPKKFVTDNYKIPKLDCLDTDGILINDFKEYKIALCKIYDWNWIKTSDDFINEFIGKPDSYPFIITCRKNNMDPFNGISVHRIYIKDQPSYYTFSESYY